MYMYIHVLFVTSTSAYMYGYLYIHVYEKNIPYSGNLSKEKTFANWWILDFLEKTDCLPVPLNYYPQSLQTFVKKTFAGKQKQ